MKTWLLLLILISGHIAFGQSDKAISIIPQGTQVSLIDFLWEIDAEKIKLFKLPGEYFYKAFILPTSEAESDLEGGIEDEVILLKGEYGEIHAGTLYNLGSYLNVQNIEVNSESGEIKIAITFGKLGAPEIKIILLAR